MHEAPPALKVILNSLHHPQVCSFVRRVDCVCVADSFQLDVVEIHGAEIHEAETVVNRRLDEVM